ncbi:exocyst subunit exo70 family protein C1 [Striga asiatica]|uniref:Exocyst subunit Exo70 family protein n=1 Tax=Striga asiatica TaxID=4170 RepID=A0A5A7QQS1_STRAF|nr:exocyst subunit exo70 family protein C1 [Striga asiatica]
MERNTLDQHNSFNKNAQTHQLPPNDTQTPDHRENTDKVIKDVDEYLYVLSSIDDKSSGPPDVPDFVTVLCETLESMITTYTTDLIRFGKIPRDNSHFFELVARASRLTNSLSEFPTSGGINSAINRTSVTLQHAMAFLEDEFRALLEPDDDVNLDPPQNLNKSSSFNNDNTKSTDSDHHEQQHHPKEWEVALMRDIANAMISCGYEMECSQAYYLARRAAIHTRTTTVLNMDDVVRMPWESLETEISRWINLVRTWSVFILPSEVRLGESIFSDHPHVHSSLLASIVRVVVIQLLDFAEAAAMARRSAEKLFKYLDMYEALQGLHGELPDEVSATAERIGESASAIFCDLESSIRDDAAQTPVPGGAVHPLTRYVINYLKYACEYRDTLDKVFAGRATPFAVRVATLMELLDENLEQKSRLYKDPSLRFVFLMNNGRYVLQKVKGSSEIREVMGDTWCRKKSTEVRTYHKSYQRETWNRVLHCLAHEGLVTNGKPNKALLKERFKIFTAIFEEIHRTQSAWVVSDEQLKSELRISVSSVVIPAYRSFVGRFRQYLESGKQADSQQDAS